jgi:hypothetical protein
LRPIVVLSAFHEPKLFCRPITLKSLYDAGIVSSMKHGIKLLGKVSLAVCLRCNSMRQNPCFLYVIQGADRFVAKINIEVTQASGSAIEAIEKAGGTIVAGALHLSVIYDTTPLMFLSRMLLSMPQFTTRHWRCDLCSSRVRQRFHSR